MIYLTQVVPDDVNKIKSFLEPIDITKFFGANPFADIIWNVVGALFYIAAYGFLLTTLIAAVQYFTSGGNDDAMTRAKKNATYSIIGLLVVFFSFAIITQLSNTFSETLATGTIAEILGNIYQFVLGISGAYFIILLCIGGFRYMAAGGNDESITKAKKQLITAVVGIALVAFSFAASYAILQFVGVNS